ncbi:type 1 glutamine amidotransferase [Lyngbya confervoides]|uniref:Type 1 glutamine amidotransferase n=1 Tax=Lyngbya confervoides BDU141951 TaxID=1574623 RepID=A0ABD4T4J4_9CYAN|nr:type 1 glutamine amidotransferase [Lyngbya confervoides]MCM1983353.1 type 1 glutamine amidotransferase [Lyngbya confervoides BDU141951]
MKKEKGKTRRDLKILLLQVREDPETRAEEFQEFVLYGQLLAHQITVLDAFATPHFSADLLVGYDALFVGGSSDASVLKPEIYQFINPALALLAYAVEYAVPVFASCFGFQLLVVALGGTVIRDRPNMEMGVYPLFLTGAAKLDPLLQDLPQPFWAISGHQERASLLPPGLINLAYSERCPYHAIKVVGKPIYGFQFHPEVNPQDLRSRLERYCDRYLESAAQTQQILATLRETPEANQLIGKFVDRILLSS